MGKNVLFDLNFSKHVGMFSHYRFAKVNLTLFVFSKVGIAGTSFNLSLSIDECK